MTNKQNENLNEERGNKKWRDLVLKFKQEWKVSLCLKWKYQDGTFGGSPKFA